MNCFVKVCPTDEAEGDIRPDEFTPWLGCGPDLGQLAVMAATRQLRLSGELGNPGGPPELRVSALIYTAKTPLHKSGVPREVRRFDMVFGKAAA